MSSKGFSPGSKQEQDEVGKNWSWAVGVSYLRQAAQRKRQQSRASIRYDVSSRKSIGSLQKDPVALKTHRYLGTSRSLGINTRKPVANGVVDKDHNDNPGKIQTPGLTEDLRMKRGGEGRGHTGRIGRGYGTAGRGVRVCCDGKVERDSERKMLSELTSTAWGSTFRWRKRERFFFFFL